MKMTIPNRNLRLNLQKNINHAICVITVFAAYVEEQDKYFLYLMVKRLYQGE